MLSVFSELERAGFFARFRTLTREQRVDRDLQEKAEGLHSTNLKEKHNTETFGKFVHTVLRL
jgi:hypothetical protein